VKNDSGRIHLHWGEPVKAEPFAVTAIHLLQSQLRATGPEYTLCHTVQLVLNVRSKFQ
jgi:2'-5' RNA ligase